MAQQPLFQREAVRATRGPHENRLALQVRRLAQRPMGGGCDENQVFAVHHFPLQSRAINVDRHERPIQPPMLGVVEQLRPGAGAQLQHHLWVKLVVLGQ
ncbi:hypothetical protein D3C73_835260 [compost metagenome]